MEGDHRAVKSAHQQRKCPGIAGFAQSERCLFGSLPRRPPKEKRGDQGESLFAIVLSGKQSAKALAHHFWSVVALQGLEADQGERLRRAQVAKRAHGSGAGGGLAIEQKIDEYREPSLLRRLAATPIAAIPRSAAAVSMEGPKEASIWMCRAAASQTSSLASGSSIRRRAMASFARQTVVFLRMAANRM